MERTLKKTVRNYKVAWLQKLQSCMVTKLHGGRVRGRADRREWLQRHRVVVLQEILTDSEELRLGRDTADLVEELACWLDTQANKVKVLLHFLDQSQFADLRGLYGLI